LGFGAYEFCLQKRRLEKVNMKRAVEIIDRKKAEKAAEAERKRVERRRMDKRRRRRADGK